MSWGNRCVRSNGSAETLGFGESVICSRAAIGERVQIDDSPRAWLERRAAVPPHRQR